MKLADVLKLLHALAKFAGIASDVVDQFRDKHPELREGPPPDAEDSLEGDFLAGVAEDFPDESKSP